MPPMGYTTYTCAVFPVEMPTGARAAGNEVKQSGRPTWPVRICGRPLSAAFRTNHLQSDSCDAIQYLSTPSSHPTRAWGPPGPGEDCEAGRAGLPEERPGDVQTWTAQHV